MSVYIHKSHKVSILLYHLVFPAKYRRAVLDRIVDEKVRDVCLEIEKRYELKFLEIGSDKGHMHFLIQSVPKNSVTQLVTLIKSADSTMGFGAVSGCKEAALGWGILERWILCQHGK